MSTLPRPGGGVEKPNESTNTSFSSLDSSTTPTLAFNGDTFVRPSRRVRKGLQDSSLLRNTSGTDAPDEGAVKEVKTQPSAPNPSSGPVPVLLVPGDSPVSNKSGSGSSGSSGYGGSGQSEGAMKTALLPEDGNGHNHTHSLSTEGSSHSEENFECFGESGTSFVEPSFTSTPNSKANAGVSELRIEEDFDLLGGTPTSGGEDGKRSSLTRNGWQRTSLRKTTASAPTNGEGSGMMSPHRRWGSFRNSGKRGPVVVPSTNALANQLYRSSSYHSSGRSSAGEGEEMYSDSSLEGEVIDLTKKVHHLEEKFTVLAESQHDVDDRYARVKQENGELKTKLFLLEEQLRDVELRAEDKVKEQEKRHKESLVRLEREKSLQLENLEIKLQMLEKEGSSHKVELKRVESALERERGDNNYLADKVSSLEREVGRQREENRGLVQQNRRDRETLAAESVGSQQALTELKQQLESLSHFHMNGGPGAGGGAHTLRRNDSSDPTELRSRLTEAEEEIKRLKVVNNQLQEVNEELNAQMLNQRLEDGRNLLKNLPSSSEGNSLAAEFEAMSNEEDEYGFNSKIQAEKEAMTKMRTALKDQKESNHALRAYIDNILLNIVEHYPQLLEVKRGGNNGMVSSH